MILPPLISAPPNHPTSVFVSGRIDPTQRFDTFRIPALCRSRTGTLLAFAEARRSEDDQSGNQLVLRRLPVGASDWTTLQVIGNEEPSSLNNPCVLATTSGRIWLMYQRYPKGYQAVTSEFGLDPATTCHSFVCHSDDDGVTWSAPDDITSSVKQGQIRSVASGPGVGIELKNGAHKGRLVFPFNEGTGTDYDVFSVFTDDEGATWKRGPSALRVPGTKPNENQIAEAADGIVRLNCRNEETTHLRLTTVSYDGGETWGLVEPDENLPDPVCMGSIVSFGDHTGVLGFSNAANSAARTSGALRFSTDGGVTWPSYCSITPGSFSYSCLCPLSDHEIGIIYETWEPAKTGKGGGYRILFDRLQVRGQTVLVGVKN